VAPAGSAAPSLEGLTAAAERVARTGLRLDGASPDLWAALGAVAAEVRIGACFMLPTASIASRCGVLGPVLMVAEPLNPFCSPPLASTRCRVLSSWTPSVCLPGWPWHACMLVSFLASSSARPALNMNCLPGSVSWGCNAETATPIALSLPAEHGASGPAVAALQHARSQEPAVPAIWEAMADVAALSSTGWLVFLPCGPW
jgi:hypothetical protein